MALAVLALGAAAWAAASGPKVERVVVCSGVENGEPVGVANAFPASIERVYCFVDLADAAEATTLKAVWYYQGSAIASIGMVAKPPDWRTWSFKRMSTAWAGSWRVVVEDADAHELAEVKFKLRKP